MKIIIDNSNLYAGGGIQVALSFLRDLKSMNLNHEFHVIQSLKFTENIKGEQYPDNFKFYNLALDDEKSIFRRVKSVKNYENLINADCIFTVFGPSYHKSKIPKVVGFAIPHLIYPDSPFISKISSFEKIKLFFLNAIKRFEFNKNSNALIFESDYARNYYCLKNRITFSTYCVNNTLNEIFLKKNSWKDIQICNLAPFNILCLSANYVHKNLAIIPEIIDILKDKYNFTGFKFNISLSKTDLNFNEKYDENINYLNKIDIYNLPKLYEQMQLLFMPTLLEVFSTTYLEAMFMKVPILASDMPFARDICKSACLYSSPTVAKDYAEKIYELYSNISLRESLIERGSIRIKDFGSSMDRTNQYLKILEKTYYENTK